MKITAKSWDPDGGSVDIDPSWFVKFGEGQHRVRVMVREGAVEISTGSAMLIRPRVSNVVVITVRVP